MYRIREIREAMGYKQKELAEKLDIDSAVLSRWESGKMEPSFSSMRRVAKALGVSVEELAEKTSGNKKIKQAKQANNEIEPSYWAEVLESARRAASLGQDLEVAELMLRKAYEAVAEAMAQNKIESTSITVTSSPQELSSDLLPIPRH